MSSSVSPTWLQNYVNRKYAQVASQLKVSGKKKGKLVLECDEMWSFVGKKDNKIWLWLAIDRETREIVGFFCGDRSRESARKLWEFLPPVYRQCAVVYTDFWESYETIFPHKRHRQVGKETGQTNHIERFNNTLRQRVSRLVRKTAKQSQQAPPLHGGVPATLSFSKKLENHVGAILYFLHYYNELLLAG